MSSHSRSPSPPPQPLTNDDNNNDLDDVWGDDDPSPSSHTHHPSVPSHPSDIPRLQQEHATAGYRDGITAAKATSAQAGFDEGFGLGAVIGARAGKVLGVLEGLSSSLPTDSRLAGLVEDARRELGVVRVFSPEYWDGEGVWKFEVPGKREDEVVFADVAGAHPLVRKWEGVLGEEAGRFGVDMEVLSGEEGVVRVGDEGGGDGKGDGKSVGSVKEKKALDW